MNPNESAVQKNIQKTKDYIQQHLMPILHQIGEYVEGNLFMLNHTSDLSDFYITKVKNISNLLMNPNIKNAMEIGFNSGFSTLLMLISNPNVVVTCYDLGDHQYTIPCYQKIKETFGDRIQLILGDSRETLKKDKNKYDFIHIDGGHSSDVAESDIRESYRCSKKGTILIMDDYDTPNLHELWDKYVKIYNLKNLKIDPSGKEELFHNYSINDPLQRLGNRPKIVSTTHIYDTTQHDIKYVMI
jgi:predicted O-methyltransferase YrrM